MFPTSNRNWYLFTTCSLSVVYLMFPTSNRNDSMVIMYSFSLYILCFLHQTATICHIFPYRNLLYILCFLHQTATPVLRNNIWRLLYILCFLHQTATADNQHPSYFCCISYVSYIKPQPFYIVRVPYMVVYLMFPTSNRNFVYFQFLIIQLYILCFLHQTATANVQQIFGFCCISYVSYIKPQLFHSCMF